MEDLVLILYVFGLLVLFFFLGAAIGGAARSFKTSFFSVKPHKSIFENPFAGAGVAAAAGATVVANQHLQEESHAVQVVSDEPEIAPAEQWPEHTEDQQAETGQPEMIDDVVVSRSDDETESLENQEADDTAQPLTDEQMPVADEFSDAEVSRDEEVGGAIAGDQPAEETLAEEVVTAEVEAPPEVDATPEEDTAPEFTADDYAARDQHQENEQPSEEVVEDVPPAEPDSEDQVEAAVLEVIEDTASEEPVSEEPVDETTHIEPAEAVEETDTHLDEIAEAAVAGVLGASLAEDSKDEDAVVEPEPLSVAPAALSATEAEVEDYSDIVFITEGEDDDLTLIKGIDTAFASSLSEIGLRRFDQVAALNERQVGFLRDKFGLSSTLNEEGWIEQAKILSSGQLTAYAKAIAGEVVEPEDAVQAASIDEVATEDTVAEVVADEVDVTEVTADAEPVEDDGDEVQSLSEEPVVEEQADETASEIIDLTAEEKAVEVTATEVVSEEIMEADEAIEEASIETIEDADLSSDVSTDADDESGLSTEEVRQRREDRRVFGEKERAQRDEEWKSRYQSGRRIQPKNGNNGEVLETAAFAAHDADAASDTEAGTQVSADIVPDEPDEVVEADVVEDVAVEAQDVEGVVVEDTVVEPEAEVAGEEDGGAYVRPVDSDDLKQIKYISTGLEKKLNLLGVYKLSQIVNWSDETISEISEQLEFRDDRIVQEDWRALAQEALDNKQSDDGQSSGGGLFSASALIARLSELDKIEDLSEHEKTMLSNNGITELSQIANWSGADADWARTLLDLSGHDRINGWIATASSLISDGQVNVPGGATTSEADELKRIRGIDDEAVDILKNIGVITYEQIAAWQQSDMDRINGLLGTAGRVERQYWVVQAKVLKDGGDTDFSKLFDDS